MYKKERVQKNAAPVRSDFLLEIKKFQNIDQTLALCVVGTLEGKPFLLTARRWNHKVDTELKKCWGPGCKKRAQNKLAI